MLESNTLIIIALCFGLIGGLIYLKETLSGQVKPNRVTYFLWFLLPVIGFFAAIDQNVGLIAYFTLLNGLVPGCILIASFANKDAYWKLDKFDYLMGVLAIIGVALWLITGEGNLAIAFAVLADGLAGIPTIRKAYKQPETESIIPYSFAAIGAVLTTISIVTWDFAHYAFPIYFVLLNCSIVLALILGKKKTI